MIGKVVKYSSLNKTLELKALWPHCRANFSCNGERGNLASSLNLKLSNVFIMVHALCLLIGVQLAGTLLADAFGLPVPGPVIGLLLLLIWLIAGGRVPSDLGAVADGFIRYLPLLFVPAAVGLVQYLDLLSAFGADLLVIIIGSTLAGLVVRLIFSHVAAKLSPPR